MGAALAWRPLHDADRQPAIRVDIVRWTVARRAWLEPDRHPMGVYDFHRHRDLDHAVRRLRGRSPWSAARASADDSAGWHWRGRRLADECLCRQSVDALRG